MPAAGSAVYLFADTHNRAEDVQSACSVAVSYKPPMLVTRARLPACATSGCDGPQPWMGHVVVGTAPVFPAAPCASAAASA